MADIKTMEDLFLDELRDLYDAEKQITKALPKMIKAAHNQQLRNAFETHLQETNNQVARLEQIFNTLNAKSSGEKCDGMNGVLKEGEKMIDATDEGEVRDAGIIAAAQRVEHYEMAGYGSAREFAQQLGYQEAVRLLQQTLDEEKHADQLLTQIAESMVNQRATSGAGAGARYSN
jgi:ferritin-like metal-binding protein YciE